MRDKNILLLTGLAALSGAALSTLLGLPAAAASLLGALLALPIPWWAMRLKRLRQERLADEHTAAIASASVPLLLLDAEGHLLAFSRGLEQLSGLTASARQQPMQALPGEWQSLIAELHAEALERGCSAHPQWPYKPSGQASSRSTSVTCVRLGGADESPQLLFTWTPHIPAETPPPLQSSPELAERNRTFLQTLIDVIPQPVYIKRMENGTGRYLLVNDAFCASHNRSRESLIGCSAHELLDPVQASTVVQEDSAIAAGSSVFREEQGKDAATGQERFLIVSKQSCLSPEGERVIVGTNFDVTPWRLAEREVQHALDRERSLRERTQSFVQRIIDVIPYPVHVKDAQSRYLIVNDAFVRERGCSREELLGHDPSQVARIMTEERVDAREEENQRAAISLQEDRAVLAGQTIIKEEHNRHSVTGEERFRTVFKCACQDIEGQAAIVTAMFDITKWSLAERELQQTLARERNLRERTQAFIQRFIDVIPQPVYMKNAERCYLMINDAFARELRRERSSIIGHSSDELAPTPGIAADSAQEDAAVLAGAVIFREKRDQPYAGAPPRDRIISKHLCLDVDGQPVIVGNHVDISKLREAEQELQAAMNREQARGQRTQAYLQRVIDVIPQEVYIKDAEGRIVMVNRAFLHARRLDSDAGVIGHDLAELAIRIFSEDPAYRDKPEAVAEAIEYYRGRVALSRSEDQQVLAGQAVLKEERRRMHLTGDEHYLLIAKESCLDVEGKPVIVCANVDITALRMAEQALQEAQKGPAAG